jgi:uncharacterized lipoprotein YddW (UPF0748 family)
MNWYDTPQSGWQFSPEKRKPRSIGKHRSILKLGLLLLLLILVAIGLFRPVPTPAQTSRPEIRGVWFTSNDWDTLRDRSKMQAAIRQLAQLNFNTIYPVVWNAGYALYPSAIARQGGFQPFVQRGLQGQDILVELIAESHRQGLLVVPWFEFGFMAPPTSELALNYANWLTQQRDGGQTSISAAGEVVWLNPFRPEVQQLMTNLVLEVITQYDVDGIQFDDHTSLPNQFGYDGFTTALYKQETKREPHPDPQNPQWVRWRADKLTAFIRQLHRAVKARKPQIIFSLSPASYDFAYKAQLQDWLAWVRLNLIDELIVQIYKFDLSSFTEKISRPEIQETQQKIPTAAGVLTGLRTKPVSMDLIQSKVRAAQSQGLGVAFFYYESLWNTAPEDLPQRQSGFQALFPSPARRSLPITVRSTPAPVPGSSPAGTEDNKVPDKI